MTQDNTNRHRISDYNNLTSARITFDGLYRDHLVNAKTGFACWSIIVKRLLLLDNKIFFSERLSISEDVYWNINVALHLPDAHFVSTNLNVVRYIVTNDSAVNTTDPDKCKRQLNSFFGFFDELCSINPCPDYLQPSVDSWKTGTVNQAITRFLSIHANAAENARFVRKINEMIAHTRAGGKIVSFFNGISKSTSLIKLSQLLYSRLFLPYIKPRLRRN